MKNQTEDAIVILKNECQFLDNIAAFINLNKKKAMDEWMIDSLEHSFVVRRDHLYREIAELNKASKEESHVKYRGTRSTKAVKV